MTVPSLSLNLSFPTESCSLSNTTFPHILPLLFLLEKSAAVSEGLEPWESVEAGVDVVMFHLGAARTFAQQGDTYCSNAETKLKGKSKQFVFYFNFQLPTGSRWLWSCRLPGASRGHGALPH